MPSRNSDVKRFPPFAAAQRPGQMGSIVANGIDIRCWRAGRGPSLVFLHGLGWDGTLWWPFVERYLDRFDVICLDTRGHGGSTKAPGPYSIDLFAQDVLEALDELKLRQIALIGLSQGGMTAQAVALRAQERITRLALLATAPRTDPGAVSNLEKRLKTMHEVGPEAAARIALRSVLSEAFLDTHAGYADAFVAWRAAMDAASQEAAMRASAGYDVLRCLPQLRIPTLVVAGGDDKLISPAVTRLIADAIPGALYSEISGSGHMIPVEQPVALAAVLDPFLQAEVK